MTVTLITGADGHLGRSLAEWLLENGDGDLLLYVRADNDDEQAAKGAAMAPLSGHPRCRVVFGNLEHRDPFPTIGRPGISTILHCAAATSFGVDRNTARAANVEGTRKILEFAAACPQLERFGYLSSLYAAGLRGGRIEESAFDKPRAFANHYEWSKWEAEKLVSAHSDLPWQVFRVATLLCDDRSGVVTRHNAIHNTLRLLFYGLLPVIPGIPEARINMVTTQFAVQSICRLLDSGDPRAFFNVSDSGGEAQSLGGLLDTVFESFLQDTRFAGSGILKPRFCDQRAFETLVESTGQFGGAMSQALGSIAPFAPQLFFDKDVQTERTTAALGGIRAEDTRSLVATTADFLAESRWGLQELPASVPA